jgi:hypothetical protein
VSAVAVIKISRDVKQKFNVGLPWKEAGPRVLLCDYSHEADFAAC